MRRYITLDRMGQILQRGLPLGAKRKGRHANRWEWAVHGNCTRPVDVLLTARTEYKSHNTFFRVHPVEGKTVMLDLTTRCRKCDECKRAKAFHWACRAEAEISAWPRTWLGTLTLSPEMHYSMKLRAASHCDRNGIRFEELDTAEQFQLRCAEIGRELTLYLKRIRKAAGGKYRFLVVYEKHQSGLPHVHLLVHECDPLRPVRKRTLQDQWKLGFSNFKLVDKTNPRSGSYATKYVAKENLSRVRASQGYGLSQNTLSEPSDLIF